MKKYEQRLAEIMREMDRSDEDTRELFRTLLKEAIISFSISDFMIREGAWDFSNKIFYDFPIRALMSGAKIVNLHFTEVDAPEDFVREEEDGEPNDNIITFTSFDELKEELRRRMFGDTIETLHYILYNEFDMIL